MISTNAIISLIIWFAKFTDLVRDVTDIRSTLRIPGSVLQLAISEQNYYVSD